MDTYHKFEEKEYRISDSVWKALFNSNLGDDAQTLRDKAVILKLMNRGFLILREDGRILGYDQVKGCFIDTRQYFGRDGEIPIALAAKVVLRFMIGAFVYGLVMVLGRILLAKNGLPTMTPGVIYLMPLPDRIEFLESQANSLDSAEAGKVGNK